MRRFSGRELLLLTAPIAVLGVGIWGAHMREQHWPTEPRITCEVRSATPLEISQGAQVGVTVRTIEPSTPDSCFPSARNFSIANPQVLQPGFKRKLSKAKVWEVVNAEHRKNYFESQTDYGYIWTDVTRWEQPLNAEVSLRSLCGAFPERKQGFDLTTKGIIVPEPQAAQRPNFRVTKAVLH